MCAFLLKIIPLEERIVLDAAIAAVVTHVIYVNQNAPASSHDNGTSWANAYTNLQDALTAAAAANHSEQIWVAKGDYSPGNLPTSTYTLPNNVSLYGGFNGTEKNLNQRNIAGNPTLLDGEGINSTIITANDVNAIIDGFTIENAYNFTGSGGGISETNGSTLNVNNDTFLNNFVFNNGIVETTTGAIFNNFGGGIYDANSVLNVNHSSFTDNEASIGGAIGGLGNVSISVENSTFTSNEAGVSVAKRANEVGDGGAIGTVAEQILNTSALTPVAGNIKIDSSNFQNNYALQAGGAIYEAQNLSLVVTNTLFQGNLTVTHSGGAIQSEGSQLLDIQFDNFNNNVTTGFAGAAISDADNQTDIITNSVFNNNTAGQTSQSGNDGGALDLEPGDGNILIAFNIFTNNTMLGSNSVGGAFDTYQDGKVAVLGNIFIDNSAPGPGSQGGAIWDFQTTNYVIAGNFFYGNTASQGSAIWLSGETTVNGQTTQSAILDSLLFENFGLTADEIYLD